MRVHEIILHKKKRYLCCTDLFLFISIYFYLFLFISILASFVGCKDDNPLEMKQSEITSSANQSEQMIEVKNLKSVPDTVRLQFIKSVPSEFLQTYCTIRFHKFQKGKKEFYKANYSCKKHTENEYSLSVEYDSLERKITPVSMSEHGLYKHIDNFLPTKNVSPTKSVQMLRHIWRAFEHANYQGNVLDCWWDVTSTPASYNAYIPNFQNVNFDNITSSFMMHSNNEYLNGLNVYLRYDFWMGPIVFGKNPELSGDKRFWYTSHNIQNFYDLNFDGTLDNMNDDISSISVPFFTTSN